MLNGTSRKSFDWTDWATGTAAVVIIFAVVAVLILVISALRAWVLTELWALYLIPLFGFQELPFAGALGVCLIASFLTMRPDFSKTDEDIDNKQRWVRIVSIFLAPLSALFLGHAYLWIWPL
jgi:hypothetical protein